MLVLLVPAMSASGSEAQVSDAAWSLGQIPFVFVPWHVTLTDSVTRPSAEPPPRHPPFHILWFWGGGGRVTVVNTPATNAYPPFHGKILSWDGKILSGENSKGLIFSGASRWRPRRELVT